MRRCRERGLTEVQASRVRQRRISLKRPTMRQPRASTRRSSAISFEPHSTIVLRRDVLRPEDRGGLSICSSVGFTRIRRRAADPATNGPPGMSEIVAGGCGVDCEHVGRVHLVDRNTVETTWTSWRIVSSKSERMERSTIRQLKMAVSEGDLRLINPPGIFRQANLSSKSTTAEKSIRCAVCDAGCGSTVVSPCAATTAPPACFATFPVENSEDGLQFQLKTSFPYTSSSSKFSSFYCMRSKNTTIEQKKCEDFSPSHRKSTFFSDADRVSR